MGETVDRLSSTYHYELAVSLNTGNSDTKEESAFEAAIAVALSTDATANFPCCVLYCDLSGKDWRDVYLVRTTAVLNFFLLQPETPVAKVFVLLPGDYLLQFPVLTANAILLAAAPGVIIRSRGIHALHLEGTADILLRGISFRLDSDVTVALAACIAIGGPSSSLKLIDCDIPKWPGECGILIDGGVCSLSRCTLSDTGKQAIEVRQGGCLDACATSISNCSQGVTAYGGARTVSIVDCTIRGMIKEGILATGSRMNAATAAQQDLGGGPLNFVSVEAVGWGKRSGLDLDLVIRNSVIESSSIGVSIDYGCRSTIHNCKVRHSRVISVFIKGESPTLLADSLVNYGNADGVRVGANYSAPVQLINNSFVGKSIDKAVIDEFNGGAKTKGEALIARQMGMWTYPVVQKLSRHFINESERSKTVALAEDNSSTANPLKKLESLNLTESRSVNQNVSPTLDVMRISRVVARSDSLPLYYAIGNTHGFDVSGGSTLSNLDDDGDNTFYILLAACGDIRNILKTVDALASKSSCSLHFVLNDVSCSILARDILLLSLIEQESVSTRDVISVWANHALTQAQGRFVQKLCERLSNGDWPSFLLLPADSQLEDSLRECFRQWLACPVSLESLLRSRSAMVMGKMETEWMALSVRAVTSCGGKPISKREEKELSDYFSTGSLSWGENNADKLANVNPTILEAPYLQYNLYWSSSIFRAIRLIYPASEPQTLTQRLVTTLEPQINSVRDAMRRGSIRFSLMLGDIVNCAMDLSSMAWNQASPNSDEKAELHWRVPKFHFIDTSNVSDYVSLPVILQLCSRILHRSVVAIIHAQSMKWKKKQGAYFSSSFAMKRSVYSEMLGLVLSNAQASSASEVQPAIQMVWRWKSKESAISQTQLLENLTSAAKTFCLPRAHRDGGVNSSGSLVIAHLALCATGSPSEAKSLIQTIASSSHGTRKYKWQLALAGELQAEEPLLIRSEFVIASFIAEVDAFKLMMTQLVVTYLHLVLAVTSAPLTRGDSTPCDKVLQFIDAFAFDCETYRVQLMLTKTLISRIASRSYSITLCGCLDDLGRSVLPLSNSVLMNSLEIRDCQEDKHRSLGSRVSIW